MIKPIAMSKFKTTTSFYRHNIFVFGILTVLFVLQYFEDLEEYEECEKIIQSIRDLEYDLNTTLFTKITKEAVTDVIDTFKKLNLTGNNVVENSMYLSTLIVNDIETNFST